jgi:hypothetical protein
MEAMATIAALQQDEVDVVILAPVRPCTESDSPPNRAIMNIRDEKRQGDTPR